MKPLPGEAMDKNGWVHAPAALILGKESLVSIEQEAE
jgi:hypothetical protein